MKVYYTSGLFKSLLHEWTDQVWKFGGLLSLFSAAVKDLGEIEAEWESSVKFEAQGIPPPLVTNRPILQEFGVDRLRVGWLNGFGRGTARAADAEGTPIQRGPERSSLGGVPLEQNVLKGHLARVIYHRAYSSIRK